MSTEIARGCLFFKAVRGKCIHHYLKITERPDAFLFCMTFDFTILLMQATETA